MSITDELREYALGWDERNRVRRDLTAIAYENGRWLISGHDMSAPWVPADSIRHYHAPTVEDVLRQVIACANNGTHVHGALDTEQIVAEYAKQLKLAEGVDDGA